MKLTRQRKVLGLPTTNLDNNTVSKCKVVGLGRPPSREWVTSMVGRSGLNRTTSYWFGWSPPVGVPGTSTQAKRVFSWMEWLLNKRRLSMSGETVSMQHFLKDNVVLWALNTCICQSSCGYLLQIDSCICILLFYKDKEKVMSAWRGLVAKRTRNKCF